MAYTAVLGSNTSMQTIAEKNGARAATPAAISSSCPKLTTCFSSSALMKMATTACHLPHCPPRCPCAKATLAGLWTAFAWRPHSKKMSTDRCATIETSYLLLKPSVNKRFQLLFSFKPPCKFFCHH
jgi:hypothetical protein